MNNISIFIINLASNKARKTYMQKLCDKHHLLVDFIDAIDGKKLTKEQIDSVYCSKKVIKEIGREMTKGEIGCALSHHFIYKKMLNENI